MNSSFQFKLRQSQFLRIRWANDNKRN